MKEYAMALKNGKDIVHRTNQQTIEKVDKILKVQHLGVNDSDVVKVTNTTTNK